LIELNQLTKATNDDIQQQRSKYCYRSGNYHIVKSGNTFVVRSFSIRNSKCKHSEHFLGKEYPVSFPGLDEAIQDCICMASKSLKRNSGELIYQSDQDPKRQPRLIQQVEWIDDEMDTQVEMAFEYLQDPEEEL
jgi:hypothetical protein